VVELENGEYAERDDCVEVEDEWYEADDGRLIEVNEEHPDTGSTWALKDDCWEDADGHWHRDDIDSVTLDGGLYTQEQATAFLEEKQIALALEGDTMSPQLSGLSLPTHSPTCPCSRIWMCPALRLCSVSTKRCTCAAPRGRRLRRSSWHGCVTGCLCR
jgi:hypothetical protein